MKKYYVIMFVLIASVHFATLPLIQYMEASAQSLFVGALSAGIFFAGAWVVGILGRLESGGLAVLSSELNPPVEAIFGFIGGTICSLVFKGIVFLHLALV